MTAIAREVEGDSDNDRGEVSQSAAPTVAYTVAPTAM